MQHIGDANYKRAVIVEMTYEEYEALNKLGDVLDVNREPGVTVNYGPAFDLIARLANDLYVTNRTYYPTRNVTVTVTKEIKIGDAMVAKG